MNYFGNDFNINYRNENENNFNDEKIEKQMEDDMEYYEALMLK